LDFFSDSEKAVERFTQAINEAAEAEKKRNALNATVSRIKATGLVQATDAISAPGVIKPTGGDALPRMLAELRRTSGLSAEAVDALNKQFGKLAEEVKPITETQQEVLDATYDLVNGMTRAILSGVDDIGKAFIKMVEQILIEIAAKEAARAAVKGIASLFGIPLPFQSGRTFKAQGGVINDGVRGLDNIPVLLGRGERVISHAQNDDLQRFIGEVRQAMGSGSASRQESNITFAPGAFQFNIESGLDDPRAVQEIVNQKLMPAIGKAIRYQTFRRS
jgi:hypothetical protein